MKKLLSLKFLIALIFLTALVALPAHAQNGRGQGFETAIAAQERHTDALLAREGVVGTAVGLNPAGRHVVQVFTEREGVPGVPSSLDRVPVVVRVTGEFVAEDHATGEFLRPVPIGVSSSNEFSIDFPFVFSGTLGARLVDDKGNADPLDDKHFALSNNHIFANENGSSGAEIGTPVIQPGRADGGSANADPTDTIGTLFAYVPIEFDRRASNLVDAAIAEVGIDEVGTSTPEPVEDNDPDSYEPSTSNLECGADDCSNLLGALVKKYGRTTELTHGVISGVNAITIIKYDSGHARFIDQLIIDPVAPTEDFSAGGDSGSLVVTEAGENPVGLHFAGGGSVGIANRIDLVFEELADAINDDSTVVGTLVVGLSVDGKAPTPAVNVSLSTDKAEYTTDETAATLTAIVSDEGGDPISLLASGAFVTTVVDSANNTENVGTVTFGETGTLGTYTAILNILSLPEDSYTATVDVTDGRPVTGNGTAAFAMVAPAGPGSGTGTVQGRVTSTAGAKISGATVKVEPTGPSDTTNNGGKYSIADVPAGLQDITASATGCTSQTVLDVEVVANASVKQDFALEGCG